MTIYAPALVRGQGPLYVELADAIERDIEAGTLAPGERLPTHRDLADALGVNVSTVTRGYREAEKRGLISATVGRGTFVTSDAVTNSSMVSFEPCAPGMLELGLIAPLDHLDPEITEAFRRIARRRDPASLLRYSDPRGQAEHRRAGALWAERFGVPAQAEDVVVCAGSQHALTCALGGLLRPGDRLAVDELTYPGLKTLAAMLGLRLVPIPMDEHGMDPAGLDAACRRDEIKALYLMPGVHNPTTATLSEARRNEIARLADRHDLILIEDDAYDLTDPGRMAPVGNRAPHRRVYIAGMSKSLAAGLRVAFVVAPQHLVKPLAQAVLNTVWMAPPLNVELAAMWIHDGTADRVVEAKRAEAARRYMLACDVLDGLRFRGKRSGFFLWLELPEPWTGRALEQAAAGRGVSVFGAEKFTVGQSPAPRAARVSLTGAESPERLREGLVILRDILRGRP
ncbi:transcriptional regulator, GntR family with aminotransferase domain-containing protein [Pseudodesulfovibrio mercurii]|uniref:Transcriptional regulator, GntR family with aminotransferase domain-containing protein n=1 Tax=Pseudodesulfovibrio mercurii TaxID=641491 RepID=F0JI60_9BACT|nr:PLP-dependent aminotransferase family protein [Pseudodesulfovibrio mercurii]EGB15371.1 transcriptional regulator, GntR family with aminotransferase domain-containing protein [Pseudodesulfovibrio mercurii]